MLRFSSLDIRQHPTSSARCAVKRRLDALVYARHRRVLMGWKSPVGEPPSRYFMATTSPRQGQSREGLSEGSRRQSCEPRNTNTIEGRHPWGESAQHDEALWFRGHGKWRGCAAKAHVLIRGDLPDERPVLARGAGLRPPPERMRGKPTRSLQPRRPRSTLLRSPPFSEGKDS